MSDSDVPSGHDCTGASIDQAISLTTADIETIEAAVTRWPLPWFEAVTVWDANGPGQEGRYAYVDLKQIAGPAFGVFLLGRSCDRFGVTHCKDDVHGPIEWPTEATAAEAIAAVESFVFGMLSSWGLRVAV